MTKSAVSKISLKDDRLDIDQIDHYSLSFFIAPSSIQISVFDEKRRRLLLYEKYDLVGNSIVEALDEIHHDHVLISAGFWQTVRICIDSHQFSIVPSELFSFEHQYDYIRLNSHTDPNRDAYRSVTFDPFEVAFVFALEKSVIKWFSDKYFNLEVRHAHLGLNFLRFVHKQLGKKNHDRIFVNLGEDEMICAGVHDNHLAIYNQFPLATGEQLIKHLLICVKQFSTQGQGIEIHLWGQKSRIDELGPLLKKYFKNLVIGTRPKIKIGTSFSEFESHELIDVLSVYS